MEWWLNPTLVDWSNASLTTENAKFHEKLEFCLFGAKYELFPQTMTHEGKSEKKKFLLT